MDNIDKLKEKVSKDPASMLFVPLAEEYRKASRLDEAIDVLKAGIERQPNYMSARVSLGKIFLEKSMLVDAKEVFENVVKSVPSNLFAQRKLADIFKELGELDKAIAQYETVLAINPLDEEAQAILKGLQSPQIEEVKAEEQEVAPGIAIDEIPEAVSVETVEEPIIGLDKAPDWASGIETGAETSGKEEISIEAGEYQDAEVLEETSGSEDALPGAVVIDIEEKAESEIAESSVESAIEALSVPPEEEAPTVAEAAPEAEVSITEDAAPVEVDIPEAMPIEAAAKEEESPKVEEQITDLSEADTYIRNNDYKKAMHIYRTHLSMNPENLHVLQRVEELRALLKILGRENEMYEYKLHLFLDAIKERKNEFLRTA